MDKKALQLCSRFALTPNQLGYCGKNSAPAKLNRCIIAGDCSGVEEELGKFIVLNPYLQTISAATNLSPFSYHVIEAYWFGNRLLDQIKPNHYDLLLINLAKQGVPNFLIDELRQNKPKKFIPIHLFNILHVGVGRASGSVPFNLNSINNCMIRWGKVLNINKTMSRAQLKVLSLKILPPPNCPASEMTTSGISYQLIQNIHTFIYNPIFTPNLKIGNNVAIHWGFIAKILTKKEENNLQSWTKKLITNL